jgi:hypothetical protein
MCALAEDADYYLTCVLTRPLSLFESSLGFLARLLAGTLHDQVLLGCLHALGDFGAWLGLVTAIGLAAHSTALLAGNSLSKFNVTHHGCIGLHEYTRPPDTGNARSCRIWHTTSGTKGCLAPRCCIGEP